MQKLVKLAKSSFGKYLVVGGSVYVLELVVIVLAQRWGATAVEAVSVSFIVGLLVSFVLQKLVTFGDKRVHHRVLVPQFIAVTLLVIFNFGFTVLVTKLFAHVLPAVVARTLALGATTIWNFYLYRTRIFKTDESPVY
ncbi:MAG TPA: GtrA family protein [Candidatus Saccharimonadales bacterium]|nr:GtrA family protein [Candidatus Saccharimonadales bacterium]